jgi:hypothetical protein
MSGDVRAQAICDHWVARRGLGFHPDTHGSPYEDEAGDQALTDNEAADYDEDTIPLFRHAGRPTGATFRVSPTEAAEWPSPGPERYV